MRNGSRLEPVAEASVREDSAPIQLDQASVSQKPGKSAESEVTQSQAADFGSTSFSFKVERSTAPDAIASSRLTSFPKLDTERSRETLPSRAASKRSAKTSAPNTSKATVAKARARGGMRTLLDKYISFLAGILKAIERFLLRRFTGNNPAQQKAHSQTNEKEETTEQNQQNSKAKSQRIIRGPGISI